jgi:hypothetical protein
MKAVVTTKLLCDAFGYTGAGMIRRRPAVPPIAIRQRFLMSRTNGWTFVKAPAARCRAPFHGESHRAFDRGWVWLSP